MTVNTVKFVVLQRATQPMSAVIVNDALVAEGSTSLQVTALKDMARRLSVALGVSLSVHELPASDQVTWDSVIAMTKPDEGESSVPVKHWGCYGSDTPTVMTHQLDVADQRHYNGQLYAALGSLDGNVDDILSMVMEVNTNPLNGLDQVPCVQINFDLDAGACSLFKIGDNILIRPETGVVLEPFQVKTGNFTETFFWMKDTV